MNYLAVGLAIILIIVIYYIYYYMTNNALTSGLQELNKPLTITYEKLINPNSMTYSYQAWIYLSSPTATSTQIFYRGNSSGANSYSEFEVDLSGQTLILQAGTGSVAPNQVMTITTNYPIQKWTYLVINVSNLNTFEAYINGKLTKTVNVSSGSSLVPTFRTSSLYIGNTSLNGYVTKFTRLPKVLDAKTVWENYLSGNGLSSFLTSLMPYGLNMSISNGEDVVRVVNMW